ncbi:efflux RND transporter periplasmic adaptor subunit [Rhizobium sullae]|uniref:efflux RND transporter periplasmic adaptor subunit n=1 Tax=Rhizobium sullae TaxID=50338 RepID=UPI000B35BD2E|nr:efflux RND transporter periplasmic adaptor subunit [Rhizobium sullae]
MRHSFSHDQFLEGDPSKVVLLATDRPISRRRVWPYALATGIALLAAALVALYIISARTAFTLSVPTEGLTIATATKGAFTEFIPLRGRILPQETVFLDMVQDGRVEEIFHRAGDHVAAGAPLVRISNPNLELSIATQESSAIDHLNSQMALRLNVSQTMTGAEAALEEARYRVEQLQRQHTMQSRLVVRGVGPAAEEQRLNEDLAYWKSIFEIRRRTLDRVNSQAESIERSVSETSSRLQETIAAARSQLDALVIRAPITGYLTHLDVSLGRHLATGQSIGQIDDNEGFKVEAMLDEFYLGRVRVGQHASGTVDGVAVTLSVASISPRITDGKFKIEAEFDPSVPMSNVTRGQAITGRLDLAQRETDVLTIPLGAFWETTGGNWIFVVNGSTAERRNIQVGRRTVESVEIVGGLKEGDRVITSSYQGFGDYQSLSIN